MTQSIQEYTTLIQNQVIHLRKPIKSPATGLSVLLHGWTGDENSMNAFWRYMSESHWLYAPRAAQNASPAGYGWAQITPDMYPSFDRLLPSVRTFLDGLQHFRRERQLLDKKINLVGFSQGAAVAYMLAALIPEEIQQIACIAGFLPAGTLNHLQQHTHRDIRLLILHGAQDKLVPVEMAQETYTQLKDAGFPTELCIDEKTGHKLGPNCTEVLKSIG